MNRYTVLIFRLFIQCLVLVCCTKETDPENLKSHVNNPSGQTFTLEKLDSLFLRELKSRKILMISDANHGQGYFMFQTAGFLNAWLDHLSPDSSADHLPRKMVLFLECNKDTEQAIQRFISTGDVFAFLKSNIAMDLEAHSNVFTLDYMEFMHALRNIQLRIRELNTQRRKPEIVLHIAGAERDPPYYQRLFDMERDQFMKERDAWFIKRDKLCSENIASFLDAHPGYKALVFYGSLHLMRTRAGKDCAQYDMDPEIFDYYLSHYLDAYAGRDQVAVFWYASNPWIVEEKVDRPAFQESMADYIIFSKPVPAAPLTFSFAKTRTYLRALHELLRTYSEAETPRERHIAGLAADKLGNALSRTMPEKARDINRQFDVVIRNKNDTSEAAKLMRLINGAMTDYQVTDGIRHIPESVLRCTCPDSMMYYRDVFLMLLNIPGMRLEWPREALDDKAFRDRVLEKSEMMNNHMDEISRYLVLHQLFIASDEERPMISAYLNAHYAMTMNPEHALLNTFYVKTKKQVKP